MALGAASIDDTIAEAGALQTTPLDASAASDEVALRADGERGAASGSSDAAAAKACPVAGIARPAAVNAACASFEKYCNCCSSVPKSFATAAMPFDTVP